MTDYGAAQDHVDAWLELLRAEPLFTVYPPVTGGPRTVPDGAVPPYLAAHFVIGRTAGGRLDMRSTRMVVRGHFHCVGKTDNGARRISDLLAQTILDVELVIPGRTCAPIRWESNQPPREDESIGSLIATLTEVYRLESFPGTDAGS